MKAVFKTSSLIRAMTLVAVVFAAAAAFERHAISNSSARERPIPDSIDSASATADPSARKPAAQVDDESCGRYGFDSQGCARVQAIVSQWKSPEFAALPVVGTPDPEPVLAPRPDARLDQANALTAEAERAIGPCRFNETEARVEVQSSALKLSNEALAKCLATAFAQSRYRGVESRWLGKLGAHEAWIVRGDKLVKVEVDRKIENPAARTLWASFAASELLKAAHASSVEAGNGRAVASIGSGRTSLERDVQDLLGLE